MAAVVFDAVTVAKFGDHLQIKQGPLFQALGLNKPILGLQFGESDLQFLLDRAHGGFEIFLAGDMVAAGKNSHLVDILHHYSAQGIDDGNGLNGIAKKLDPHRMFFFMGRKDVNHVAPDPERAAMKRVIVALIEHEGQAPQNLLHRIFLAGPQEQMHVFVFVRRTEAINARH